MSDRRKATEIVVDEHALSGASRSPVTPARAHNLPPELSSIVGREGDVARVKRLLRHARLLTLTGAGGVGKTRLALRVAHELVGQYRDGVWLVELAPLAETLDRSEADPNAVVGAIATALGICDALDRLLPSTLANMLRGRDLLLVLDGCERLIEPCAMVAGALLRVCPRLRILVTSQQPLNPRDYAIYAVSPLPVPGPRDGGGLSGVSEAGAVRLFVERARAADPTFALTVENRPAVVEVCRALEGIPLALELAAARLRVLSVEQLATRLGDALRVLGRNAAPSPPRQRSVRAALNWSYEMLSESERALFRRLSVFAGGWTADAAEAVCADCALAAVQRAGVPVASGGDAARTELVAGADVLDLLESLLERSLITAVGGESGGRRLRMHEVTRQYAAERLRADGAEEARVRCAHAAFLQGRPPGDESELWRPRPGDGTSRFDAEYDDLRAAVDRCLAAQAAPLASMAPRLTEALWSWLVRGQVGDGGARLDRPLDAAAGAPDRLRGYVPHRAGPPGWAQADYAGATAKGEAAHALREPAGDSSGPAIADRDLDHVVRAARDVSRAVPLFTAAEADRGASGSPEPSPRRHERGRGAAVAWDWSPDAARPGGRASVAGRRTDSLDNAAHDVLTPRQREVAILVAHGMSNVEIADHLVVTVAAVKRHVHDSLAKLQLRSRTRLAIWVRDQGLG